MVSSWADAIDFSPLRTQKKVKPKPSRPANPSRGPGVRPALSRTRCAARRRPLAAYGSVARAMRSAGRLLRWLPSASRLSGAGCVCAPAGCGAAVRCWQMSMEVHLTQTASFVNLLTEREALSSWQRGLISEVKPSMLSAGSQHGVTETQWRWLAQLEMDSELFKPHSKPVLISLNIHSTFRANTRHADSSFSRVLSFWGSQLRSSVR